MSAVITRYKQPQRHGRYAWKWIYQVNDSHDADTLHQAKEIAKRLYGGFRLEWESQS